MPSAGSSREPTSCSVGSTAGEIAVWGLSFKEGTDDLRDSPAVAGRRDAGRAWSHGAGPRSSGARQCGVAPARYRLRDDLYEAAADADAVALCTPWPEYASVDFNRLKRVMRGDLLLDGRNMLDSARAKPRVFATSGSDEANATCRLRTPSSGYRFPQHRPRRVRQRGDATCLGNGGRRASPGPFERKCRNIGHSLRQIELSLIEAERLAVPIGHDGTHVSVAKSDRCNQQRVDVDRLRCGNPHGH